MPRGGKEVHLHSFLTTEIDGGDWFTSLSGHFTPRERATVPIELKARWAPEPIGNFWRRTISCLHWGSKPRPVQPTSGRSTLSQQNTLQVTHWFKKNKLYYYGANCVRIHLTHQHELWSSQKMKIVLIFLVLSFFNFRACRTVMCIALKRTWNEAFSMPCCAPIIQF
jgi:hypothetical protein